MALVNPTIFQIVGYQNSGKTTSMFEVIRMISSQGYRIATIKHHGHGGKPDIFEKKDSGRHIEAGALASLIEGEGRIIIQAEQQQWSLQEEIKLTASFSPDVILIEGHKQEDYPKAVLLRDERDLHLIEELSNIKVICCRKSEMGNMLSEQMTCPVFVSLDDTNSWIVEYLKTSMPSIK